VSTSAWRLLAVATLILFAACDHWGVVAPDGATLRITPSKDTLHVGQDSASIAVAVLLVSGDLIPYGADVTFVTSGGTLCVLATTADESCGSDSVGAPGVKVTTTDGVARVLLRGGNKLGTDTVLVVSGEARDSILLPVIEEPTSD